MRVFDANGHDEVDFAEFRAVIGNLLQPGIFGIDLLEYLQSTE